MGILRDRKFALVMGLLVLGYVLWAFAEDLVPVNDYYYRPAYGTPISFFKVIRPAAILTNAYVDTNTLDLKAFTSIALNFSLTKGSLTSFQYIIYISDDLTTWYQEATETVAASVITDTANSYTYVLSGNQNYFKVVPIRSRYIKLAVKGTGTVTGSSCAVTVTGRY